MEKSELLKSLAEGVISVTFTKKDGTDRVMLCTRKSSLIPTEFHPKGETVETGDNIRVFDVEKNGWRSFNLSTLKV